MTNMLSTRISMVTSKITTNSNRKSLQQPPFVNTKRRCTIGQWDFVPAPETLLKATVTQTFRPKHDYNFHPNVLEANAMII